MAEEAIGQTFIKPQATTTPTRAPVKADGRDPAHTGAEYDNPHTIDHDQYPGLPQPPGPGASALLPAPSAMTVFVTGGGTGLGRRGHRHRVRPPRRHPRRRQSQAGAPRRRTRAPLPLVAPAVHVSSTATSREPEQIAAAFDTATEAAGLPGVLVNNAAANFPVSAEDMSPNAAAHRRCRHHTLNGTFFCAREFAAPPTSRPATPGLHRQRRRLLRVGLGWTGFAHSAAGQGRGAKTLASRRWPSQRGDGIQVNGLVPSAPPHEPHRHPPTFRGGKLLHRTDDEDGCQPALRVGRVRELGWAATFLASAVRPVRQRTAPRRHGATGSGGRSPTHGRTGARARSAAPPPTVSTPAAAAAERALAKRRVRSTRPERAADGRRAR